ASRHARPLEDTRRSRRGADGARLADVVRPVRDGAGGEPVPLDRALEALADRDTRDPDLLAGLERLDGDRLADGCADVAADLDQVAVRVGPGLAQVADLRLREL